MTEDNQDWTPIGAQKPAQKRAQPSRRSASRSKKARPQGASTSDGSKVPEPPPEVEVLPPAHFAAKYEPPKTAESGKGRGRNNRRGRNPQSERAKENRETSPDPKPESPPLSNDWSGIERLRRPGVGSLPQKHEVADALELEKLGRRIGSAGDPLDLAELLGLDLKALRKLGDSLQADFTNVSEDDRDSVLRAIFKVAVKAQRPLHTEGVLASQSDGFSFLALPGQNFQARNIDAFVPLSVIRENRLRNGQRIKAQIHPGEPGKSSPYVLRVLAVMDKPAAKTGEVTPFFHQKVVGVSKKIPLAPAKSSRARKKTADVDSSLSLAAKLDHLAPFGWGQRILISGDPHTGKADVLLALAGLLSAGKKKEKVRMLMVDSRPELLEKAREFDGIEVFGTAYTEDPEMHLDLTANVLEYCQRDAENGENIVLMVDSLSKLERAQERKFERAAANHRSGPLGVLPVEAFLRRLWSVGRALEGGGSITLIATETTGISGPRRNELSEILQDMSSSLIFLDQHLRWQRYFPPIDPRKTYSRDENELLAETKRKVISSLRRKMGSVGITEAFEILDQELPNS